MIVVACLVIGALLGARNAKRRKGNIYDIAQYAVICGIAGGLVGLIVTIAAEKLVG